MKRVFILLMSLVLLIAIAAPAFADQPLADLIKQYTFPADGLPCENNLRTLLCKNAKLKSEDKQGGLSYILDLSDIRYSISDQQADYITIILNTDNSDLAKVYIENGQIVGIKFFSAHTASCYTNLLYGRIPEPAPLPKTGDSANVALYLALIALGAAGIAIARRRLRG